MRQLYFLFTKCFTRSHETKSFTGNFLFKNSFFHKWMIMALLFLGVLFTSTDAKADTEWSNNDNHWTVTYSVADGAIYVRVLVYDRDYGPALGDGEDGFIDNAHLKYSTDGSSFTDYYRIDYNSGPSLQSVSGPRPIGSTYATYTQSDDGRKIYWNVRLNLNNDRSDIKKIKIEGFWETNGVWGSSKIDANKDITITKMSAVNNPTYEFVTVQNGSNYEAKARISYSKVSLNAVDTRSTIKLFNSSGTAISGDMTVATSGSYDAPLSTSAITYYYRQSAYSDRVFVNSANITIPAFTLPKTASANYDTSNHRVTFTWTIDPVSSTNVVTDRFKLQVANNAAFTDAREVSIDYNRTEPSYTYTVESNLSPAMHFRVARARNGFNWELAKTASVNVDFNSISASSTSLVLLNNNTARLRWTPRATAWLPGSTFIIKRINNSSRTESEIRLNKTDFDKGEYIDQQIAICNEYTYTLQVVPPSSSGFAAFAPVQFSNAILPTEIGTIRNLTASKGYFPDRTELSWSAQGAFDNFIIKRAVYGTNNFVQLSSVAGSSNSDFQADDSKGNPGVYYTYMVIGVVSCNNRPVYSKDTLYAIGFRSPTGNIYGRVTYENGQAVEDVAVRLQSNDATQLGKSVYLNGSANSFLQLDSLNMPFVDSSFTVEAWIKPDAASPVNQVIFSRAGQYELGFNAGGQLYFTHNGKTITGAYSNTNGTYRHVAGIRTADSLLLMLDDVVIGKAAQAQSAGNPAKIVYIGKNAGGNNYKGFIDEMRIWNVAVGASKMARDYTRMLTGNETGLVAYWRFDETIADQFYDLSYRSDEYNRNDGRMNAVTRSANIPTADQLALKSYTDASGNYMISGIPFTGNGTTYTIVPLLGTHQFDPVSVNRLISPTSLEFTVDFKDKSSFPVSGFVYYKESTVPVQAVQFQIDGRYAQQSNGAIIETDDRGQFTISVPVGTHEVKALKTNHVFANDGRITDPFGNNLNYQGPLSQRVLYDSTTVRFIGRVAGGPIQEQYPLGHSLSSNNLGKELSIALELPTGTKYELYSGSGNTTSKTVINKHLLPSNQTDTNKIHRSRVVYSKNRITVYPDSVTGEYIVDLIPEKFLAQNALATGWGDLLEGKPVSLDFTNKFSTSTSIYSYRDSAQSNQGVWTYQNYLDTVTYNASYKFIKRVIPAVSITQSDNGTELPYFGNKQYETSSLTGVAYTVNVVDSGKTGRAMYLYGRPVFNQNQQYTFLIKAFEQYPFYESVLNNGTPVIKQDNGKEVISNVPTKDGFVSLLNSLRNGSTSADTMSLNSKGESAYTFTAGDPDLAALGIKNFAATVRFGQALNINWTWHGNPQMPAYVFGGKLTGTDFVTAGPDKVLMVLRDPPGQKSFSYAEIGSVISDTKTYSGSVDQEGEEELTKQLATELITFTGVGVGTINTAAASTGISFGIQHEEHYSGSNSKETTTTLTTRFQTSDDQLFVGPVADVFVGYSTNITYGQSNNITIIKRSELAAADILLYEPDPSSEFVVIRRGGINIGEKFGTMFAYPQQHIEKVLIPNLINIRNTALHPPTTAESEAQQLANTANKIIYVSKLTADHPNFGKSNSDTAAFGTSAKSDPFGDGKSYKIFFPATSPYKTDTILILNQYVSNWISRMADNEKAKLEATLYQNYSFHAGATVEHSKQTSVKTTDEHSFNFVISGSVSNSTDVKIKGNGFEFKFTEKIGTTQGGTFSNSNDDQVTYGFTMASSGTDDYFTVDVSKAADSSFVFRTKGGVSACPYHGANATQYYQPGTIIDQPTQRAEVPNLSVDQPVVSNVPSSRVAAYVLKLRNESEARLPQTFILRYADNDSVKGATIAVDGASIGSGRAVVVQYGETVTKVLTLTKGPTAMDYNDIMILLTSSCQYDPTGYQENIADTVLISAHFIPSCSDVQIKAPTDKWIVNTESPANAQQKRYLPIIIDRFDVNNSLFDHIELQYKPSSGSTWITSMKFYADSVKFNAAQGEKQFITNAAAILYNLEVDDAAFNDQNYDIQAVSYCLSGPANYITTASNMVSGIKDTYYPRLFGSPQPANGVLGVSDEIRLNFNETIAAGLLTHAKFQVTGIRNGVKGDHSVSVKLDGQKDYLATEFEKNLTGKNITTEVWILPTGQANETVFSQGNLNERMELALTSDNRLEVIMGSKTIRSDRPFTYRPGEWAHVAMVYNATSKTVSAFYNFIELINKAPVDPYTGIGHFEFGRSISKQGNFFSGKMHEARVWSDTLTGIGLQVNSLTQLSGAENNLLAYYPMNEGKGTISLDKAHASHAKLVGQWSTPPGKALRLAGNGYVKANTSFAPVTSQMDYTIELWFKANASQSNTTLASNGRGDGTDGAGSLNLFSLGFENGLLIYRNNGFKIQADGNYLDNAWHHVALAVNRTSANAQLFVDGALNKYFDARNLGGIASATTYIGARAFNHADSLTVTSFDRFFTGNVDEFRIWNTYLNQTLITTNNNIRLNGNEIGLMAYYPFEKYFEFQNNRELGFTLSDMKIQAQAGTVVPDATALNAAETDEMAPVKDRGPVDNLKFDFVVNNDALIITMQEPRQAIDKTVVTFKVKDVRDLNGNTIQSPVTWTAYIDQNQVKWSDNELNLVKDVYAPMQFESHIVNNGGSVQRYRLSNLPGWLKAEPLTGTVNPRATQKVVFTVHEGLNVGTYDEIIFMNNDNNESEALKVNLKVKGKEPNWTVNPADFKFNMSVYGKLRINNIFSINKEDKLAAFMNGRCVGVASNTYNAQNDLWYVFLTVYSDTLQFNNLEFRIWRASTGKTYAGLPSVPVTFANDKIVGSASNPVIFEGREMMLQDITLNQNWNWISFNLLNANFNSLNSTLANGRWASGDIIKNELLGFSQYSTNNGWLGYLPGFNNTSLFMLKTANAQTLSISGTAVDVKQTRIPVKGNRWSYISYLPQVNITVKEALAGYHATNEDVIKSQTGFSMYNPQTGWIGNLTHLEPGKGYMLFRKAANDTSFFYPSLAGSLTNNPTGGRMTNPNRLQTPVAGNFSFASNMTVLAVIESGFALQAGDNVLAYMGGEVRGKAIAVANGVLQKSSYFFNISGEQEQAVYFVIERAGEIIARADAGIGYVANATYGTLMKPIILRFKEQAAGITLYPNPFKQKLDIIIDLGIGQNTVHEVEMSVFDVTGKLVFRRQKEKVVNGYLRTTWNGKKPDGSECAAGVYLISVMIDGQPQAHKVVKL